MTNDPWEKTSDLWSEVEVGAEGAYLWPYLAGREKATPTTPLNPDDEFYANN